ncbi:nuclear transport factor 2 family protein [uncultured Aquimarina sp.]|uniref:nuclear transport factor 2 family protein n=1 Tax=uncultured Aquimarina sp. TaxID=575652 RepID=UPI00260C2209|nr:nuclear transport factor 2 family protein [uncultured Aquimarina sp.]
MKDSNNKLKIQTIIDAIDSGDPTIFGALLTEDSTFRFGNWEQVKGKPAVFEAQTNFFASVKSTKHKILRTWENEGSIVVDMMVTYVRHDDSTITLPVADIFEIKNDKITATTIFMDVNPLYNPSTD